MEKAVGDILSDVLTNTWSVFCDVQPALDEPFQVPVSKVVLANDNYISVCVGYHQTRVA